MGVIGRDFKVLPDLSIESEGGSSRHFDSAPEPPMPFPFKHKKSPRPGSIVNLYFTLTLGQLCVNIGYSCNGVKFFHKAFLNYGQK